MLQSRQRGLYKRATVGFMERATKGAGRDVLLELEAELATRRTTKSAIALAGVRGRLAALSRPQVEPGVERSAQAPLPKLQPDAKPAPPGSEATVEIAEIARSLGMDGPADAGEEADPVLSVGLAGIDINDLFGDSDPPAVSRGATQAVAEDNPRDPDLELVESECELDARQATKALATLRDCVLVPERTAQLGRWDPSRSLLRDGMIEAFVSLRIDEPEDWIRKVPRFQREATDRRERDIYLDRACAVIERLKL